MKRYGIINTKCRRQVILLRGSGCTYGKCTFCDYKQDKDNSIQNNYELNLKVMENLENSLARGMDTLQVICSGSFIELDLMTMTELSKICKRQGIFHIIFEGHWKDRYSINMIKDIFKDEKVSFNLGSETFDYNFREKVLNKGMGKVGPAEISCYYNWTNLLYGIKGQNLDMLLLDIYEGLKYFDHILLNIFNDNSTNVKRDEKLVSEFYNSKLFELIAYDERIEIIDGTVRKFGITGIAGVGFED